MNRFELMRYERGLTQQQVADGASVSRSTVVRLEQLSNPKPSPVVAVALADFYDMSVAELLGVDQNSDVAA